MKAKIVLFSALFLLTTPVVFAQSQAEKEAEATGHNAKVAKQRAIIEAAKKQKAEDQKEAGRLKAVDDLFKGSSGKGKPSKVIQE